MQFRQIKIGNLSLVNNVFLAPMAGITDLVFRVLAREFGCALCFTEMISANGLVRGTERSYRYLESSMNDKPLGVQIFGFDPHILSEAAQIVTEKGADLVDINMGCPVKKVLKTGSGAALMKDTEKIVHILRDVRKATSLPLTVKIRSGWKKDKTDTVVIAEIAQDCGVDALILHPRTVEQGFSGSADWDLIKKVKDHLQIPVIGSGDIRTPQDASRIIEMTGCDGIMVGRGSLGNPWIFRKILDYPSYDTLFPSLSEREGIIRRHLEMCLSFYGEKIGMKNFRKHLLWYTKGLKGGSNYRQTAVSIIEKEDLLDSIHRYLQSLVE
jgi:tRNA-dihydrouridine synthase B